MACSSQQWEAAFDESLCTGQILVALTRSAIGF
jgi:hypothetical protein